MKLRVALAFALALGCASPLEKGRTAAAQGLFTDAEAHFRKAMRDPKTQKDARDELARMHAKRAQGTGDVAAAEALYHRALELIPTHDQALTGLVRLLRREKRHDDALRELDAAAQQGECPACQRLKVVVLLELGDRELEKKNWDAALKHYSAAQELRKQPAAAVAIANAHAGAGRFKEAATALNDARGMMAEADESLLKNFFEIRRFVIDKALAQGDVDIADDARGVGLANEDPAARFALALLVADYLFDKGQPDKALERYEALFEKAEGEDKQAIGKRASKIYANRATAALHAGDGAKADAALSKAIAFDSEDWVLKLQRILALSGRSGARKALAGIAQVPAKTVGLAHCRAILWSLRVEEQISEGDIDGARDSLKKAQKAHPDLPEVHLATARILAETEVEGLGRPEIRALLGKTSLVDYSRGTVLRYGEALSELDWVYTELGARKKTGLFTAPWVRERSKALERRLAMKYPHKVKFREQSEPFIELANEGPGFVKVVVTGPQDFSVDAGIAGNNDHGVHLPSPGLVRLKIGKKKKIFYAEPFIRVRIRVN